jgi:hypothetical protein
VLLLARASSSQTRKADFDRRQLPAVARLPEGARLL